MDFPTELVVIPTARAGHQSGRQRLFDKRRERGSLLRGTLSRRIKELLVHIDRSAHGENCNLDVAIIQRRGVAKSQGQRQHLLCDFETLRLCDFTQQARFMRRKTLL